MKTRKPLLSTTKEGLGRFGVDPDLWSLARSKSESVSESECECEWVSDTGVARLRTGRGARTPNPTRPASK